MVKIFVVAVFASHSYLGPMARAFAASAKDIADKRADRIQLSDFSITPSVVAGGRPVQGTISLSAPVAVDTPVSVIPGPYLSVPGGVVIKAGATSATFSVETGSVNQPVKVRSWIDAMLRGNFKQRRRAWVTLTSAPQTITQPELGVDSLSVPASALVGGGSVPLTINLTAVAPSATQVSLVSGESRVIVPSMATVPQGQKSTIVVLATKPVANPVPATITVGLNSSRRQVVFTILPTAQLAGLAVSPNTVQGGGSAQGTVSLTGPASADVGVALTGSGGVVVPPSVTIKAGGSSTAFPIQTSLVKVDASALITAALDGVQKQSTLVLTAPPAPKLSAITVSPSSVLGGSSAQGTVSLTGPASADVDVALAGSGGVVVPPSVTVKTGNGSAVFNVQTPSASISQTAVISATLNGVRQQTNLTMTSPPPPPPPPPAGITAMVGTVVGGSNQQLVIHYSGVVSNSAGHEVIGCTADNSHNGLIYWPSGSGQYNKVFWQQPDAGGNIRLYTALSNGVTFPVTCAGRFVYDNGRADNWNLSDTTLSVTLKPIIQSVALTNPTVVGFSVVQPLITVNFAAPIHDALGSGGFSLVLSPGSDLSPAVDWRASNLAVGSQGSPSGFGMTVPNNTTSIALRPVITRLVDHATEMQLTAWMGWGTHGVETFPVAQKLVVTPLLPTVTVSPSSAGQPLTVNVQGFNAVPRGPMILHLDATPGLAFRNDGTLEYGGYGKAVASTPISFSPGTAGPQGSYQLGVKLHTDDWSQGVQVPFTVDP